MDISVGRNCGKLVFGVLVRQQVDQPLLVTLVDVDQRGMIDDELPHPLRPNEPLSIARHLLHRSLGGQPLRMQQASPNPRQDRVAVNAHHVGQSAGAVPAVRALQTQPRSAISL